MDPIALIKDGDKIHIDAEKGILNVELDEKELKYRKENGNLELPNIHQEHCGNIPNL